MDVVNVGEGLVLAASEIKHLVALVRFCNVHKIVEDAAAKLANPKHASTLDPKEKKAYATLLRGLTMACWPGVTMYGLLPWPFDSSKTPTTLPFNKFRMDVCLG